MAHTRQLAALPPGAAPAGIDAALASIPAAEGPVNAATHPAGARGPSPYQRVSALRYEP